MPNHSAAAVANEFLRIRADRAWPQQMLLQKLAYIAHGWMLAITGQPLIAEASQAWDNGPVYRSLWDHIRDYGYGHSDCRLNEPGTADPIIEDMTDQERAIIEHVWKKYAPMGAAKLSELTHQPDTPWSKAYFGRARNAELSNSDITEHYRQLAQAGRASRQ
jgi:uncharacterized phage-associated protein